MTGTNDGAGAIELAALAFATARKRQRQTKEALRAYRETLGTCTEYDNGYHPDGRDTRPSCFQTAEPVADWCAVCQGSQPLWEARRQAARDAGVALQRLMRACTKAEASA